MCIKSFPFPEQRNLLYKTQNHLDTDSCHFSVGKASFVNDSPQLPFPERWGRGLVGQGGSYTAGHRRQGGLGDSVQVVSTHLFQGYLLPLCVSVDLGLVCGSFSVGAGMFGLLKQRLQLLRGGEQGVDHLLQVQPAPRL